jgi:hypothetical protein
MSTDLDTRLRSLTDLSPPSQEPLGTEELHRRATRRQQRALALRAVPAIVVVVAVLAGAVALRSRSTTTDVVVGPPDTTEGARDLAEHDRQVLAFLGTVIDLRHEVERELVLSAVFSGSEGTNARDELPVQRAATDAAVQRYQDGLAALHPSLDPGGADAALDEAIDQANNRVERLAAQRTSVDAGQTSGYADVEAYESLALALNALPQGYLREVDDPDVFRGLFTVSNLGAVTSATAATAGSLTVAVEVGFYADELIPAAGHAAKGRCGDDPAGAGNSCMAYFEAVERNRQREGLDQTFQAYATGEEKQRYRLADAGTDYHQLVAAAFEDGVGINDLRGGDPGSVPVDLVTWRTAALDYLDRLARAERDLFDRIGVAPPDPTETTPTTGEREIILQGTLPDNQAPSTTSR